MWSNNLENQMNFSVKFREDDAKTNLIIRGVVERRKSKCEGKTSKEVFEG